MARETLKLLRAQRDEAREDADRFYKAGKYMAAALRFYGHKNTPYYSDAVAAVKAARKALAGVAPYPYPGSLEAALKAAYAAERGGRDA